MKTELKRDIEEPNDEKESEFITKTIEWTLNQDVIENKYLIPILLSKNNQQSPIVSLVNGLIIKNEIILNDYDRCKAHEYQLKYNKIKQLKFFLEQKHKKKSGISFSEISEQIEDVMEVFLVKKYESYRKYKKHIHVLHKDYRINPNLITGEFDDQEIIAIFFKIFEIKIRHCWCFNQIDMEEIHWDFDILNHNGNIERKFDNYSHLVLLMNILQNEDNIKKYLSIKNYKDDKSGIKYDQTKKECFSADEYCQIQFLQNQGLLRKWINLNQKEITNIGLKRLEINLENREVFVFYKQNEFFLALKLDGSLYILNTYNKMLQLNNALVWKSLNSTNDDDELYYNSVFFPVLTDQQELFEKKKNFNYFEDFEKPTMYDLLIDQSETCKKKKFKKFFQVKKNLGNKQKKKKCEIL